MKHEFAARNIAGLLGIAGVLISATSVSAQLSAQNQFGQRSDGSAVSTGVTPRQMIVQAPSESPRVQVGVPTSVSMRIFPNQYTVTNAQPFPITAAINPPSVFNPLIPYGPNNYSGYGGGPTNASASPYSGVGYDGYGYPYGYPHPTHSAGFLNGGDNYPYYSDYATSGSVAYNNFSTSIVIISPSGYDYNGYCSNNNLSGIYPSVYSTYAGIPAYFYDPVSVAFGSFPIVYDNGTFYAYGYDPFTQYDEAGIHAAESAGHKPAVATSDKAPSLPAGVKSSLDSLAKAWKTRDLAAIGDVIPQSGQIGVGLNGRFAYSIAPTAYRTMTRDALKHIETTDFKYTGVKMSDAGNVTAYAVQNYKQPNGSSGTVYIAYALKPDTASFGKYVLAGVSSSTTPFASGGMTSSASSDTSKSMATETASAEHYSDGATNTDSVSYHY